MILIDTCVLIWMATEQGRLSSTAVAAMEGAPDELFVSAISAFEIGIKQRKGRLHLAVDPSAWFESAIKRYHVQVLAIDWQAAVTSSQLPPIHHDPADRIIVATAKLNQLSIVSPDANIARYGVTTIW